MEFQHHSAAEEDELIFNCVLRVPSDLVTSLSGFLQRMHKEDNTEQNRRYRVQTGFLRETHISGL